MRSPSLFQNIEAGVVIRLVELISIYFTIILDGRDGGRTAGREVGAGGNKIKVKSALLSQPGALAELGKNAD